MLFHCAIRVWREAWRLWPVEKNVDQTELLERLGPVRGMLYYHLLLSRMRPIRPE